MKTSSATCSGRGGPGGQHQNKTESGVRYTHLPTGVAAESRSERSQHKNDTNALALLKAKLIRMEEEKREAEYAKKYDEKGEVSFGNQIRSYVLQPYQIVKDLRTDHEVGNPRAVLDGGLDGFIESYLRMKLAKGGTDLAKSNRWCTGDPRWGNLRLKPDDYWSSLPHRSFGLLKATRRRGSARHRLRFGGERQLGHELCIDCQSASSLSGREAWLVRSAVFSDQEIQGPGTANRESRLSRAGAA